MGHRRKENSMGKTGKKTTKVRRKRRQRGEKFDLQKLIEKTGREFHIPGGYAIAGPGTKLNLCLKRGDVPKNRLDQIAKIHDTDYSKAKNLQVEGRRKNDSSYYQSPRQENKNRTSGQENHAS